MDATFWAFAALVVFIGLMIYLKIPGQIAKSLYGRADKIRNELDEARRLREEAQELLAEYQRKRKAAEEEAASIIASAKHEAENLAADAAKKTEEFVARRTAMAEQKISQAEAAALAEVRSTAVDIAIAAAQQVIAGKMEGKDADALVKRSIDEVKSRLN